MNLELSEWLALIGAAATIIGAAGTAGYAVVYWSARVLQTLTELKAMAEHFVDRFARNETAHLDLVDRVDTLDDKTDDHDRRITRLEGPGHGYQRHPQPGTHEQ